MRYETVKLSDVADIIVGFAFKSDSFNTNGNGVRIVRGKNITHLALRWGNDTRWWNDFSINLDRYYLKEGDILIGMDGSLVGKNYARVRAEDLPLLLVQRVACIRAKDGTDQDFLWSCISNMRFELYINAIKTGTSIPHISGKQIAEYPIPSFSYFEQTNISAILRSLDDKIELNNAINNNLEQQAQALYKQMFIDSDNPERQTCRADEYFDISIGKTPPRKEPQWFSHNPNDIAWVSISDMGNCGLYISSSSEQITREAVERYNVKVVPDNTVLLSFKLTVGRIAITNGEMTTNEAIAHFKTDKKEINEYLYCYLKCFNYQTMGSTSSIATAVNSKIIKGMPFVVPTDDELQEFHNFAAPMFAKIKANQIETVNLTTLRDTLLPKLMSGELDVSDIDL